MDDQHFSKLVKELAKLPKETEWVEFKLNNSNPGGIGEDISALSNSARLYDKEHAYLIFGVEDLRHEIKGTAFNPKSAKIGNEELENWLATQLEPRIDFVIHNILCDEKMIVLFVIDPTNNKPLSFRGVQYIRVGSYTKKLSDHTEKERKLWKKCSGIKFEQEIALDNLSDDDVLNLLDYPSYFEMSKLNLPPNKSAILSKFEEEGLIARKLTSVYQVTNLGAVLFAKDLNKFESLSRKAIRVIQYKGKNKVETIKEQIGIKGYANGFDGLISYINDQLPSNEEIGKVFRKQVKMYPELAIRELVANALIHQDFSESGTGPVIEIYEDRIEISNPGQPLIDPLRFLDYSPKSRNETLASFMRRLNICEERGSGIDKVVFQTEVYQLPAPKFIKETSYFKVVLYSYKSLRQMDKEDKIRASYLHCCLKYVSNATMTNQSLRERFKVEERNYSVISRIIGDTIEAKLIKYKDPTNKSRKYSSYIPIWA